jgi:hypothetical protein
MLTEHMFAVKRYARLPRMLVREASAVVKPWYRQFYLRRGEAEWASDRVSDDGYQRGLEAIEGFVYVGTAMYGNPTSVRVAVHDAEPEPTSDEADRVVEVSVSGDGPLAIFSWASDEAEATVELPAGSCRLRASWFDVGAAETHPPTPTSPARRSRRSACSSNSGPCRRLRHACSGAGLPSDAP